MLVVLSLEAIGAAQPDYEVVLHDSVYRVNSDNTAEIIVHAKFRAMNSQGRADLSKIQVPYIPDLQSVEFKFAKTLKKDGSVVDADPSSAFDSAPEGNGNAESFTDLRYRTLIPPSVDTGDSIEYEEILHIHKWLKPEEFWLQHSFMTNARVLSETVTLDLPEGRKVALYESVAPDQEEVANGRRIERWIAENPEPRKPEIERAKPLFVVSSLLNWDLFGKWVRSLNEQPTRPTPEITALAAKLTAGKTTETARIAALYGYVATKVRYVSLSFGLGRLQPHAASAVLHNAYGDCKDQTALLTALLNASGFKTYAVLTTPGEGVAVPEVASPEQFNHEFTAVDTKAGLLFLDTSMGPVQPGVLQPGVRGRTALLAGESGAKIIEIPIASPAPNRIAVKLRGKLTEAGVFDGSGRFEFQGVPEIGLRQMFADASDDDKKKLLRQLAGAQFQNATISQIASADPDDLSKPFWIQCEINDTAFFPPPSPMKKIAFESTAALGAFFASMGKPTKPIPVEAISATLDLDLATDPSLTTTSGMPMHHKAAFGTLDSDFTYQDGRLLLAYALRLNGTAIAPEDWTKFVELIKSAQSEQASSFTVERHTSSAYSGNSPLDRAMREGSSATKRKDYEAAKRAYLEAVKIDPQNKSAWNDLGLAYYYLRQYDQAESAYKRQIEISPDSRFAYNNIGIIYRVQQREEEAIAAFRKQIEINPRDANAHDNLAISFAGRNEWEQARSEAQIAVDITPGNMAKRIRLGRAQEKTGHPEDAEKNFELALAAEHDAMTENDIAYYMTEGGMDLNKAWKLISGALDPEAGLSCHPETLINEEKCATQLTRMAHMLDTAGWILYRQGKVAESEAYLVSAFAISPSAETATHLSTVLAKLVRIDESLRYLANASVLTNFKRVDSSEVRHSLSQALGGEAVLDARLKENRPDPRAGVRVMALVDGHGKVLQARALDPQSPGSLMEAAKAVTLSPLSWPQHSIPSVRTIVFRQQDGKWSAVRSYVGTPPILTATP